MQKALRKYRDNLLISGMAVLAFGAWSTVKSVAYLVRMAEEMSESMDEAGLGEFAAPVLIAVCVTVGIFLAIDLLLRVFVGRSARKEAMDIKSGRVYLVLCVLLLVMSAFSVITDVNTLISTDIGILENAITLAVSITSSYILLELFVSAIQVKRLKKIAGVPEEDR